MADGNAPGPEPEQEARGGKNIDWMRTRPGKPLIEHLGLEDEAPAAPAPRDSG